MVQTCSRCSRANPQDAVYCYFDGFVLDRHTRSDGRPVAVGAQEFGSPFVFPSGRACRSFNELALACQEDWAGARELLQQGHLEAFLRGLGRNDLARAAREAARFPDRDRGLDQLLAQLPADVLDDPKLRADPLAVNLGIVPVGEDREFPLRLENQGMRLLYGSVSSTEPWLELGRAGASEKHFQFGHETVLPVRVRGSRLRAGNRPLEAQLLVESNGGTATVAVRAEVPVRPFPAGALGGARSPRQVAEKAKADPKAAAPLFEDGSVAGWYKTNGWTYPVQGPSASGLGAVQQFFEALGLTPPPRVDVSDRKIVLEGNVGDPLRHKLKVSSEERRPVYAHATSTQPWLEVGRARLNGRHATIKLSVPAVPDRPGETLTAKVIVRSNGNQRFVIPVTLHVNQNFDFTSLSSAPRATAEVTPAAPPLPRSRVPVRPGTPAWLHALPALLLALALGAVALYDRASPLPPVVEGENPGGEAPFAAADGTPWTFQIEDTDPRLGVEFSGRDRFGIVMLKEKDPKDPDKLKRLTFQPDGGTNNTRVLIDGSDFLYGQEPGRWLTRRHQLKDRRAWESVMLFPEGKIKVTQHVEIIPGEQSRVLDTCLVYYTLENTSTVPHKAGLRVLLDTYIGSNDGVPFVIPGQPGLLDTKKRFGEKQIPDYVEALERPDLKDPGTVAHLGLKGIHLPGVALEPIYAMLICRWDGTETLWEPEEAAQLPIKGTDSCVFLYWDYRPTAPGEKRHIGFTYGLGKIAVSGASQLGLTAGGSFRPGGVFTVTGYVKDPKKGQAVKLELPAGLALLPGQEAEQKVTEGKDYSQVSWRVRGDAVGEYTIKATSGDNQASYRVRIKNSGIFDTK
jgi:hypothetical protein